MAQRSEFHWSANGALDMRYSSRYSGANRVSSEVHKARDRETGAMVALKKILMQHEKEGVSFCT